MNKGSALRYFISIAFLALLFYLMKDEVPLILEALNKSDKTLIFVSTALGLSCSLLMARRLEIIFKAEGLKIGFRDSLNLTFIGYFFNNFLPTSVGGDIVKAMCAAKISGNTVRSVTSVLMDRVFGLFMFILIPSISLIFLKESIHKTVPIVIYSFLAFSIFCFILIFNRTIARKFSLIEKWLNNINIGYKARKIYDGLHEYRDRKGVMAKAMLLSIIGQSINIFALYLMAVALGAPKGVWVYFYLLVPVVHLIGMLPSLNGLGIREGAYIYFLSPHIGTEKAAAIGILWLGLLFLNSIIGGVIYAVRKDYHIQFKKSQGAS